MTDIARDIRELIRDGFEYGLSLNEIADNILIATRTVAQTRCSVCGSGDAMVICEGCWTRRPAQAQPDLALRNAALDALAGWKYIRGHHGDLYGVGWDRVETALEAALAMSSTHQRSPQDTAHE